MIKTPIMSQIILLLAAALTVSALAQEPASPAGGGEQVVAEPQSNEEAIATQKNLAIQCIGKGNLAQADAAVNQMLSRFGEDPGLAQAVYEIACKYGEAGSADKTQQLHSYLMKQWHQTEWAIHAQRDIIHGCIRRKDTAATQAAMDMLLKGFAQHKDIAGTIYNLAKYYNQSANDPEMCRRLHEYNVEHYPKDKQGLYSQIEIVKGYIASGDDAAADTACNKLLTTFSSDPSLPYVVYGLGTEYAKANRAERASVYYRHVLNQWPQSPHAAWAQLAILDGENRPENDPAVRAALSKLLHDLPEQKLASRDIYRAAKDFAPSHPERALALHLYNGARSPQEDQYALWSQVEVAKACVRDGNEPAAQRAVNDMISRFADQPSLPTQIAYVGDSYLQNGKYDQADRLYQYVQQRWSGDGQTLWAKAGQARKHIVQADDNAAEALFQKILADYAGDPQLPEVVSSIAEGYYLRVRQINMALGQDVPDKGNRDLSEEAKAGIRKAIGKWDVVTGQLPVNTDITPQCWYQKAIAYYELGEQQQALTCCETLLERWPDYANAWQAQLLIGKIHKHKMREEPAYGDEEGVLMQAALRQLVEKYPTNPAAQGTRSLLEKSGQSEGGEQ